MTGCAGRPGIAPRRRLGDLETGSLPRHRLGRAGGGDGAPSACEDGGGCGGGPGIPTGRSPPRAETLSHAGRRPRRVPLRPLDLPPRLKGSK